MEKTLIVLIGNPRGNETVWNTMYEYLLKPYQADLALCFEYQTDKSSSLYSKANYLWEVPKYSDWEQYYIENNIPGYWREVFDWCYHDENRRGFAGIRSTKGQGSGAILLGFRHYLLKNKKETLLKYDRIILTRSDYLYLFEHPYLPNDKYWVPKGECYGGITDRFQQFPSKFVDQALSVIDYVCSEDCMQEFVFNNRLINIEMAILSHFHKIGFADKIDVFDRSNVLVVTTNHLDNNFVTKFSGKWDFPGMDDIKIKYMGEWHHALHNYFIETFSKKWISKENEL